MSETFLIALTIAGPFATGLVAWAFGHATLGREA
jgi:hypothetical protein